MDALRDFHDKALEDANEGQQAALETMIAAQKRTIAMHECTTDAQTLDVCDRERGRAWVLDFPASERKAWVACLGGIACASARVRNPHEIRVRSPEIGYGDSSVIRGNGDSVSRSVASLVACR